MKTSLAVEITPWMSADQARDALMLAKDKGATVQRVDSRKGELVVYLSKPTLKDRLLTAFMPSEMRREARTSVDIVLKEIAKKCGGPVYNNRLATVRDAIVNPSGTIEISTSMELREVTDKLFNVTGGGATVQRLQARDGEFVVYLRKPNLKDRLRLALMPSEKRRDAQSLVGRVLEKLAEKDITSAQKACLISVRDAIENQNKGLDDALLRLQSEQINAFR